MAEFCAKHGKSTSRPYFSIDGKTPLTKAQWEGMRAKWTHAHGTTNVWQSPAVHGAERFKAASGYLHANQKPLALLNMQINASSDPGDVIWEPFGGLCSAAVAAMRAGRDFHAAEMYPEYFDAALLRLREEFEKREGLNDNAKRRAA